MLKEWPGEYGSGIPGMPDHEHRDLWIQRIKAESLPVVNGLDTDINEALLKHNKTPLLFNSYLDLPGAMWEEEDEFSDDGKVRVAFIHLPKAENSGPIRSPGCDPDNPEPDLIDQLAAANKRADILADQKESLIALITEKDKCIAELEYVLKEAREWMNKKGESPF
jgi:hypothetical protein